jgi:dipeptidyl-peptidase-4
MLYFTLSLMCALGAGSGSSQEKPRLTVEQILRNAEPRLLAPLPTILGWADEDRYLEMKKREGDDRQKVYAVDAASGAESLYRDLGQYKEVVGKDVDPSTPAASTRDFTHLVYLRNGDLYWLNTASKAFTRLTATAGEEKNPVFSPDGRFLAFTRTNDLFTLEVKTGKETRHTFDGSDTVYNGWASWVYYEEILGRATRYRAFWWSPDSKRLAFFRFNDARVPVFPLHTADGQHGTLEETRYPKAGDPNPAVRVGVVRAGDILHPVWADLDEQRDQYFGTPFWTPDGTTLILQWMNRGQDTLKLLAMDPSRGTTRILYTEHQPSWVDWFETITFLTRTPRFILQSDRDGWSHLYLFGFDGQLKQRLTEGPWAVDALQAVDEERGLVYFTARKEQSTRTDLYRTTLEGRNTTRLTFGPFTHAITPSPRGTHFITRYSNLSTPTRMALCSGEGKVMRQLGDSKTEAFGEYRLVPTELFRVRTPDGYDLPVIWTLPLDFDPNRTYPVIISVYGGPASAGVSESWRGLRPQWLAMEGLIQLSVDHRGSGHFGKAGVAVMHRSLGKWEMEDYGEVVRWLRTKHFIDTSRICITGGSYGGYVVAMALTAGADLFTHGVASFPVTRWELYDSHYTERFMDTPAENPDGYAAGSALSHAEKYRGSLLLIHGTMDDNVHMQNTFQLAGRLQDLGKNFSMMLYPGGRHGWGGPKATHLRNLEYRFYYEQLLRKPFPEDLFRDSISRRER